MQKSIPFFLLLIPSMGALLFCLDLLVGIPIKKSYINIVNPFRVMDPFEYVIVCIIFAICVIVPVYKRLFAERSN